MENSAGTDLTNTDFGKLARFVLESTPQQKVDAEHVHLLRIGRLGEILSLFGLRFCRNAVRSAESWNYEKRPSQPLDDRFTFTVAELYVLIQTAKDVHELTHAIGSRKKPAVFLGGTCGATTWRQDVVVPFCRANDINFFDPQVAACGWTPALIRVEERAKMESSAFIFYISSTARSLTSMIEVAYLIARRRNLIAVVSRKPVQIGRPPTQAPVADLLESGADSGVTPTPTESPSSSRSTSSSQVDEDEDEDESEDGENTDGDGEGEVNSEAEHDWVTADEQRELARTRDALVCLAERNGYPVFETLQHALQSCAVLIREREHVGELVAKHAVLPLELVATRYRDRMRRLHSAFYACVAAQPHTRTATCDYRIPFAQAYSLLQQACADQNMSCIQSPQYSRGTLLALLNAVTPELTSAQRRCSLSESGNGSDQLEHNQVNCHVQPRVAQCDCLHVHVTAHVNCAAQRSVGTPPPNSTTPLISVLNSTAKRNDSSKAALSSADNSIFQKLYSFIDRSNRVTKVDATDDETQRLVTFDEFCFLFAWLLESEREQRANKCAVLDGVSGVVNFVRFLYAFMLGSVEKQPEAGSGDVMSTYSSTLMQDVDSNGSPFVVHLRGSTHDSSLFDQLLVPLLTRYAIPFSIGAVSCDWRSGSCSRRSRRRSPSASRERQLPGVTHSACGMHMGAHGSLNLQASAYMSKQPTKNGPPNFANLLRMDSWQPERASGDDRTKSSNGRFDSLCARLRERFTDRVHYRCPFADTRILLFAFTRCSKSVVEMLQCAQCIGEDATMHRRIVLYVEMFEPGDCPDGQSLNSAALKDYNRVRMYLLSMAKSHERDVVRIARSRIELVEVLTTELGF